MGIDMSGVQANSCLQISRKGFDETLYMIYLG